MKFGDLRYDPTTIFSPDGRRAYYDTTYPWRCLVRIVTPRGWSGSGVLIGPRHVLTASHCVDWTPGWMTVYVMYSNTVVAGLGQRNLGLRGHESQFEQLLGRRRRRGLRGHRARPADRADVRMARQPHLRQRLGRRHGVREPPGSPTSDPSDFAVGVVSETQTSHSLEAFRRFGPLTHARVVEFQKSNQLTPDGIVGPRTRWPSCSRKSSCQSRSPWCRNRRSTFGGPPRGIQPPRLIPPLTLPPLTPPLGDALSSCPPTRSSRVPVLTPAARR